MSNLLSIFLAFFRLGMTSFGGPAQLALIKDLAVSRQKWMDETEFRNGVVLSQSLPGATAMQTAAYVGLKIQGIRGALASYIGYGLPAFLIMLTLSALFSELRIFPLAISIFSGLRVVVVALMFNAVCSFGKGIKRDLTNLSFIIASAMLLWIGVSPILVILLSALSGVILMKVAISPDSGNNSKRWTRVHNSVWGLLLLTVCGLLILFFINHCLFELATIMLQVNLFAFGGGFSSLPLMLQEVVNVHGWMNERTFMDGIVLGQITPGPTVIMATFVGYTMQGIGGAIIATIAIFTPSFFVLIYIEPVFNRLRNSHYFIKALDGVSACFVGLLLFVFIKFLLDVPWDFIRVIMGMAVVVALMRKYDALYIVLISAIASAFLL